MQIVRTEKDKDGEEKKVVEICDYGRVVKHLFPSDGGTCSISTNVIDTFYRGMIVMTIRLNF